MNAEAYVAAELEAHFAITADAFTVQAYAGAEASASVNGEGDITLAAVPGTSAHIEGAVAVSAYAHVGADGGISYGDGEYGVGGDVGEAIGEGFITGIDAVANGFIAVGDALVGGFISGVDVAKQLFSSVFYSYATYSAWASSK